MNHSLTETLRQVTEETLSSLAFMFPLSDDEASGEQTSPMCRVEVEFSGPFSGRLTLAVQADMVSQLAANMLGLEDGSPNQRQQEDAVKEVANVICGNLLPMVGTPADVFNVSEPRLLQATSSPAGEQASPAAEITLRLDTGLAAVALYVSDVKPSAEPVAAGKGGGG